MYKYEDFKDNTDLVQYTNMVLFAKMVFADNWIYGFVTRGDLLNVTGCDTWMKLACIDKLHELGYIDVVVEREFSNDTTYRNVRL